MPRTKGNEFLDDSFDTLGVDLVEDGREFRVRELRRVDFAWEVRRPGGDGAQVSWEGEECSGCIRGGGWSA